MESESDFKFCMEAHGCVLLMIKKIFKLVAM